MVRQKYGMSREAGARLLSVDCSLLQPVLPGPQKVRTTALFFQLAHSGCQTSKISTTRGRALLFQALCSHVSSNTISFPRSGSGSPGAFRRSPVEFRLAGVHQRGAGHAEMFGYAVRHQY